MSLPRRISQTGRHSHGAFEHGDLQQGDLVRELRLGRDSVVRTHSEKTQISLQRRIRLSQYGRHTIAYLRNKNCHIYSNAIPVQGVEVTPN